MEIQASRSRARVGPSGKPIVLFDQNLALWDRILIHRGLAALERAGKLGGARGADALRAAIAACHGRALTPAETDWPQIVRLYSALCRAHAVSGCQNRALAVAMASGPQAGLDLVDALTSDPSLKNCHLLPGVRGDLLAKVGRFDEARVEFERAASLARNARERRLLLDRARAHAEPSCYFEVITNVQEYQKPV